MGFSFSLEEFLNHFSAGFIFVFGISITNWKYTKIIFSHLKGYFGDGFILICFIVIYIIGIIIYGIAAFFSSISYEAEELIDKNKLMKIFNVLYKITLYSFFKRWSVIGTFHNLSKKNKLPPEISNLETYNDLDILAEEIRIKSKYFSQINFFRSLFFQTIADSILYVFVFNIITVIFKIESSPMVHIGWIAGICVPLFFIFKGISPIFAEWYLVNIARTSVALGLNKGRT